MSFPHDKTTILPNLTVDKTISNSPNKSRASSILRHKKGVDETNLFRTFSN